MASSATSNEPITIEGRQYRAVREGLAQILAPYRENSTATLGQRESQLAHNNDEGDQAVFYNPIQQYNRDLSVLAILTYGEGALAEKEAKFSRSRKHKKAKKQKATDKTDHGNAVGKEGSKKRKADEIEEVEEAQSIGKKLKINDQHDDVEADGLEVQQLQPNNEVDIVTEQSNKNGHASEPQRPNQPSTVKASEKRNSFTILDALSASGLRAIRYAKEIPFATNVIANDLSPEAVKSIEFNIDQNNLRGKVHSNVGDARAYMYSKVGNEAQTPPPGYVHRFDVIDLDPYGTAAPFLDAAVQALTDGGLLCVTCTDAGVFASNGYPEKAYALYGGVTMKGHFSHEAGLRLILHAVATSAAKYGIAIEPLLSLSIDFYARLFIRVHKQQQQVKLLAGTTMIVYNCDFGCSAWKTQLLARNQGRENRIGEVIYKHSYAQAPSTAPLCDHCGTKMHLAGPMWAGPLHNPYFIQQILDKLNDMDTDIYHTTDRIRGMLTTALEEDLTLAATTTSSTTSEPTTAPPPPPPDTKLIPRLPPEAIDTSPFFFIPSHLSKVIHCQSPPEDLLRGAIRHLGYKVTRSHCKAGSFKTNAPWDVLWEIMREWTRQRSPLREGAVTKSMPGWRIMQRVRGTESKDLFDVQRSVQRALERGVDGRDELRALLESGLYRLEHSKVMPADQEKQTGTETGTEAEAEAGSTAGDPAARGTDEQVPKPAWNEPLDVSRLQIVFDADLGKEKPRGKLVRYQSNPRANWGPMNRARGA